MSKLGAPDICARTPIWVAYGALRRIVPVATELANVVEKLRRFETG